MSSATAHRLSLGAGLLLLTVVLLGALQPVIPVCGNLQVGYAPILAFEFARSIADLHALFGSFPGACRAALVARMDLVNWGDCVLFVPAYGAFLVFFFVGIRAAQPSLARIAIQVTLIACAADYVENACLLQLTGHVDAPGFWLSLLPWATGVKWGGLGVAGLLGGLILAGKHGLRSPVALLSLAGLAITLLAVFIPHQFGRFASLGVTLSWVSFLAVDVCRVAPWRTVPKA